MIMVMVDLRLLFYTASQPQFHSNQTKVTTVENEMQVKVVCWWLEAWWSIYRITDLQCIMKENEQFGWCMEDAIMSFATLHVLWVTVCQMLF